MPDQTTTHEASSAEGPAHDAPGQDTTSPAPGAPIDREPAAHEPAAYEPAAHEPAAYEPLAEDRQEWDEPMDELPARPRRRLLAPLPLALLGVLLIACGFIAGALVEKGQTSSSSSAAAGDAGLAQGSRPCAEAHPRAQPRAHRAARQQACRATVPPAAVAQPRAAADSSAAPVAVARPPARWRMWLGARCM